MHCACACALYVANQNNNKEVVQLLVASGANLNLATEVRTWLSAVASVDGSAKTTELQKVGGWHFADVYL